MTFMVANAPENLHCCFSPEAASSSFRPILPLQRAAFSSGREEGRRAPAPTHGQHGDPRAHYGPPKQHRPGRSGVRTAPSAATERGGGSGLADPAKKPRCTVPRTPHVDNSFLEHKHYGIIFFFLWLTCFLEENDSCMVCPGSNRTHRHELRNLHRYPRQPPG